MKSVSRFVLILFFSICFTALSLAQTSSVDKGPDPGFAKQWRIGLTLGPDFYYGDLNSNKFLPDNSISFATGLFGEYQVTNVFGIRFNMMGSWLRGTKSATTGGKTVDDSFSGILTEASVNAQINFSNLFSPYRSGRNFFFYGTIGIGYAGWNTELIHTVADPGSGSVISDPPIRNFYSAPLLPVGLGVVYRVAQRVNISAEWTFRTIFSDMVDQTTGGFVFDSYNYLALGISINLGKAASKSLKPKNYDYPVTVQPSVQVTGLPIEPINYNTTSSSYENYDYVVQIFAFERHTYKPQWIRKRYKVPQPVRMEKDGSMERFLVGNYKNLQQAIDVRDQLIRLGIRDAFVVAYKNGIRSHTVAAEK